MSATRNIAQRTLTTLRAGGVRRWHAAPEIAQQTDAAHAWGVAVIVIGLCEGLTAPATLDTLVRAALLHDAAELFTGDIPRTVKHARDDLNAILGRIERDAYDRYLLRMPMLSDMQRAVLALADYLEAYLWARGTHPHFASAQAEWQHILRGAIAAVGNADIAARAAELVAEKPFN